MNSMRVEARGLNKSYPVAGGTGVKVAVKDVSFAFAEGERVGVIGRNGAGKSTLLQLLAGISAPSGGTLHVHGRVTAVFTLGMGLRDDLTGIENIYVEGQLQGRSRTEVDALVHPIAEFAELGDFIYRPVRTYSTGMKARLAFATIVHNDPEILIIDEALSVGDAKFAAKATAKMRELAARGKILIVVSHSMASIESMCNRCIWMDDGAIRMDGDPGEVTKAYLDEVRRQDDEILSRRFRNELRSESFLPGWTVDEIALLGPEGVAKGGVVTGDFCSIQILVSGAADSPLDLACTIERLDGIVLARLTPPAGETAWLVPGSGRARITMDLGALPVNFGLYRALIEVWVAGEVAARRAMVFEVLNPRPHPGARPILIYPTKLSVSRIS